MDLKFEDWVCLSRANLETKKIDLGNRLVVIDTDSILRLEAAGIIDSKGNLTEAGLKSATQLGEKIKVLRRGVSIDKRKRTDHKKVCDSPGPWLTGSYHEKDYMSDGHFFIYGKPYAAMNAKKGSAEFRKHIPTMLSKVAGMTSLIKVEAAYWQLQTLGGLEIVWLMDAQRTLMVPVQGMYYDLIIKKFPSAEFFVIDKPGTPVKIEVEKKGFHKDVAAVVMPVELEDAVERVMMQTVREEEKKDAA